MIDYYDFFGLQSGCYVTKILSIWYTRQTIPIRIFSFFYGVPVILFVCVSSFRSIFDPPRISSYFIGHQNWEKKGDREMVSGAFYFLLTILWFFFLYIYIFFFIPFSVVGCYIYCLLFMTFVAVSLICLHVCVCLCVAKIMVFERLCVRLPHLLYFYKYSASIWLILLLLSMVQTLFVHLPALAFSTAFSISGWLAAFATCHRFTSTCAWCASFVSNAFSDGAIVRIWKASREKKKKKERKKNNNCSTVREKGDKANRAEK